MSVLADRASGAGVLDRLQVLRSAPTPLRGAPAATWPPSPRTGVRQLRVAGPGLQPGLQDTTTTRTDPAGSTLATPVLGPRNGVHLPQLALDSAGTRQRNRNIRARSRVGKRKWYVASGYSRRSKVETTFHRYKAILGSAMRARGLASQRVEVRLGCKILNTMTALGIPDGEMIG